MALDSAAFTDANIARVEVPRWINEVAVARGWTAPQLASALAAADRAWIAADEASYFGADVRTYWATLAAEVTSDPAFATYPGGASFIAGITGTVEAMDLQAEYASRQGLGGVLGGLGAAASDVGTAAADAGKQVAKTVLDPRFVWGVAAIVIAIAVIKVAPRSGRA